MSPESELRGTRRNPLLKAPQGDRRAVLLGDTYGEDFPGGVIAATMQPCIGAITGHFESHIE